MKTKEEIEKLAIELAVNNAYKWFEYPKNIPPIHSENYLIFVDGYIEIDLFRDDHNKFNSELYNKNCNITHWMSLPNKPLNKQE